MPRDPLLASSKIATRHAVKTDRASPENERIIALEMRVAELERLIRELQQSQGTTAKPAEKPLRSRGMLDRPRTGQ